MPHVRRPQPGPIRLAHWANVPLLVIMAASGLQILAAYPMMGPRGALYDWYPYQGLPPPEWARLGGWLAGARHWHFAFGWFFVLNGAVYVAYLFGSGEWRRRLFFPRRDSRDAVHTAAYYLRLRKQPPVQEPYNGLQRFAYTGVLVLALVEVLSGLTLYKPVQMPWLKALFGGYDPARAVHLLVLALLALFTVGHLVMVALHPRTLGEMVTGGRRHE